MPIPIEKFNSIKEMLDNKQIDTATADQLLQEYDTKEETPPVEDNTPMVTEASTPVSQPGGDEPPNVDTLPLPQFEEAPPRILPSVTKEPFIAQGNSLPARDTTVQVDIPKTTPPRGAFARNIRPSEEPKQNLVNAENAAGVDTRNAGLPDTSNAITALNKTPEDVEAFAKSQGFITRRNPQDKNQVDYLNTKTKRWTPVIPLGLSSATPINLLTNAGNYIPVWAKDNPLGLLLAAGAGGFGGVVREAAHKWDPSINQVTDATLGAALTDIAKGAVGNAALEGVGRGIGGVASLVSRTPIKALNSMLIGNKDSKTLNAINEELKKANPDTNTDLLKSQASTLEGIAAPPIKGIPGVNQNVVSELPEGDLKIAGEDLLDTALSSPAAKEAYDTRKNINVQRINKALNDKYTRGVSQYENSKNILNETENTMRGVQPVEQSDDFMASISHDVATTVTDKLPSLQKDFGDISPDKWASELPTHPAMNKDKALLITGVMDRAQKNDFKKAVLGSIYNKSLINGDVSGVALNAHLKDIKDGVLEHFTSPQQALDLRQFGKFVENEDNLNKFVGTEPEHLADNIINGKIKSSTLEALPNKTVSALQTIIKPKIYKAITTDGKINFDTLDKYLADNQSWLHQIFRKEATNESKDAVNYYDLLSTVRDEGLKATKAVNPKSTPKTSKLQFGVETLLFALNALMGLVSIPHMLAATTGAAALTATSPYLKNKRNEILYNILSNEKNLRIFLSTKNKVLLKSRAASIGTREEYNREKDKARKAGK